MLRHDLEELVELDGAVVVGVRAQHHLALESGTKLSLGSFGQNLNPLGCFWSFGLICGIFSTSLLFFYALKCSSLDLFQNFGLIIRLIWLIAGSLG